MTSKSAFKTPEGKAAFLAAYEAIMELWPVPYEEIEIPTRFGVTHIVTSGPEDAPPMVLLHGQCGTLTMWGPNIADFSKDHRVYAIDVMGQPGKSIPDPDEPIRDLADFMAWLGEILDGLNLDRIFLVGVSYGGWLGLNLAMAAPERVRRLALLSPAASFQPFARQFSLRAMPMFLIPTRLTVKSYMGWLGIKDTPGEKVAQLALGLIYLGLKHFRMPPETARIAASVFSDHELRALHVPVLLLIGEDEVMYDAAKALARARRLIPDCRGELVPNCSHDMCSSQHEIVDAGVLDFLVDN
jgi:pimeloyl-ACP methyl ester carboxylesterase